MTKTDPYGQSQTWLLGQAGVLAGESPSQCVPKRALLGPNDSIDIDLAPVTTGASPLYHSSAGNTTVMLSLSLRAQRNQNRRSNAS